MTEMKEKSINYFNNIIMPLICEKYSDILDEINFIFHGSVGLGIDDELSDVEAIIYLPEKVWKARGGYLQIDLDKLLLETNLWQQRGSILCVHPLSWAINNYQGEKIIADEIDIPWSEIEIDTLFNIQNDPIFYDPQGRMSKLREMTAPDKMPEILWKKALRSKLSDFVSDGPGEIKKCIDRNLFSEANIYFGKSIQSLLEAGFLACRQYYPYIKHLRWAFDKLPSPIKELGSKFDLLSVDIDFNLLSIIVDWQERLNIMETIFNAYKDYIISNSLLPELDFNRINLYDMPLHDNELNIAGWILDNPNWRAEQDALMEKTLKMGFEPAAARWVGWWEINENPGK